MTLTELISRGFKGWHGVKLDRPDWGNHSHAVALSAALFGEEMIIYCIFNSYWEPLDFELPAMRHEDSGWRRWIDTFLDSPEDIVEWQRAPLVHGQKYRAGPRSVVILWAKP
jgi:glycogen operon protein